MIRIIRIDFASSIRPLFQAIDPGYSTLEFGLRFDAFASFRAWESRKRSQMSDKPYSWLRIRGHPQMEVELSE